MVISREVDYGIRCVLYLSGRPDQVTMVEEISSAMRIPKSFLAKILQKLTRKGLVRSLRGVNGGFLLQRRPKEISLLDVIKVFQKEVALNKCAVDNAACSISCSCVVHPVWVDLRKMIEDRLAAISFEDMSLRNTALAYCDTNE